MPSIGRMRYLTTVVGSFHGRVVAARLGAEGILVHLKGVDDGPYRLQGMVEVYVQAEQLELAREVLLADAVDDVFDSMETLEAPPRPEAVGADDLGDVDGRLGEVDPLELELGGDDSDLGPAFRSPGLARRHGVSHGRARVRPAAAVVAIAMVAVLLVAGIVAVVR